MMALTTIFYINHPRTGHMFPVRPMNAGEEIKPTDFYFSSTRRWLEAPCAGCVIQAGCETSWARPIDPETGADR